MQKHYSVATVAHINQYIRTLNSESEGPAAVSSYLMSMNSKPGC